MLADDVHHIIVGVRKRFGADRFRCKSWQPLSAPAGGRHHRTWHLALSADLRGNIKDLAGGHTEGVGQDGDRDSGDAQYTHDYAEIASVFRIAAGPLVA